MERSSFGLIRQLAAWPTTPDALRPADPWPYDPVLCRLANGAEAGRTAASDPAIFAALAARPGDPVATSAVMAVLASRLLPVSRRWGRARLPREDLADCESSLLTAAIESLRAHPDWTADHIARTAWHRAHNQRRTERARAARLVPLPARFEPPASTSIDPLRQPFEVVTQAIAAGALTVVAASSLWATVCGWRATDAARAVGCSPEAWRARRSRAARVLRATVQREVHS